MPGPSVRVPTGARSGRTGLDRFLLQWEAEDGLDPLGRLVARTGQVATFSRGGTVGVASTIDANGCVHLVGKQQPRFYHQYNATTGLWECQGLQLEGGRQNLCTYPQALTSWGVANTGTTVDDAVRRGTASLSLLTDTDAVASYYRQSASFQFATGSVAKAMVFDVKQGTSTESLIRIRDDAAGTDRLYLLLSWVNGAPSCTFVSGALLASEYLGDGVYRLFVQTNALVAAATNHTVRVHPVSTAASTGSLYFGSVNVEDATFPSEYIPQTSAALTRSADSCSFPFNYAPAAMTVYADIIDRGSLANSSRVWQIGNDTEDHAYVHSTGSVFRGAHYTVVSTQAVAPAFGDRVELNLSLTSDGKVALSQSINTGTETVASTSAAKAMNGWSNAILRLNQAQSAGIGFAIFRSLRIAAGIQTMAHMRAA